MRGCCWTKKRRLNKRSGILTRTRGDRGVRRGGGGGGGRERGGEK